MSYQNLPPSSFQGQPSINTEDKAIEVTMYSDKDFKEIYKNVNPKLKDTGLFGNECNVRSADKILCGVQQTSVFSNAFFSDKNISEIQKLIRYQVYLKSDKHHTIGNQSKIELLIVMKSIYLQYSKVPESYSCYPKEIGRLNDLTVHNTVPDIINNIEQYLGYIKDSSSPYNPIDRPVDTSNTGVKEPRSFSDVLFSDATFFG